MHINISFCVEEFKLSYSALNGHGDDFGQNLFTFKMLTMLRSMRRVTIEIQNSQSFVV